MTSLGDTGGFTMTSGPTPNVRRGSDCGMALGPPDVNGGTGWFHQEGNGEAAWAAASTEEISSTLESMTVPPFRF